VVTSLSSRDQFTGRPRGFGFVEMASKEEASKAIVMLNGRLFRDSEYLVDEARPAAQPHRAGGQRGGRPLVPAQRGRRRKLAAFVVHLRG
jgi:RNA recognition motif-containing protein